MSTIGKIREKSVLILIVVGVAMLLFVVDPTQVMNWLGQSSQNDTIGEFEGEPMSSREWGFDRMTQNANEQQQEQIWRQMIQDTIYKRELEKLGLEGLSKNEVNALIYGTDGMKRHSLIENLQQFYGPDGRFSEDTLIKRLPLVLSNPSYKEWWGTQVEPTLKQQRNRDKYLAMIKQGLYVTSHEVKNSLKEAQTSLDVKYAYKSFASVSDSLINVTEEDLKAYYEAHKNEEEFQQKTEIRAFDYIEIAINPSEEDKQKALNKIEMLKEDFASTDNDSLFVSRYAETATYNNRFRKSSEFPAMLDSVLQASDSGDLIGPYEEEGFYKLSKIKATKLEPEATVRHILFAYNGNTSDENDAKLKAKADSVLRVIRQKKNFEEMVQKFSDDPGSKANGGKYEWFPQGQMVTEFNDFSFDKPIGTLGVVKTQFGYHIVEVLDRRKAKTFQVATVDAKIQPQQFTRDQYYDKGLEVYDTAKEKSLEEAAGELGYTLKEETVNLSSPRLSNPNLLNNSEILRWAFNTEVDNVSEPFMLGEIVVVAQLKNIMEEGVMSFETVKKRIEQKVKKEKKAEFLKALVNDVSSVEGGANAFDVEVKEQLGLTLDKTNITGVPGNEGETVGKLFGLSEGLAHAVEGQTGVFVVEVNNKSKNESIDDVQLDQKWSQMLSAQRSKANSGAYSALNKKANVKDYRNRLKYKNKN